MESSHVDLRGALPAAGLQSRLLAMLQWLDARLTASDVPYWITGGTLLGAVRHRGFIPHDDDLDLEILESDLCRAQEALGAVGASFRGLGQWDTVDMGRFFFWGRDSRFTESVDVFLRSKPLEMLKEFPSEEEIFPLKRLSFHNIEVMAPRKPEAFLERCYPGWAHEVVAWNHTKRHMHRLQLKDYLNAVAAAGYEAPVALKDPAQSLLAVGLECLGDLRRELDGFTWASPWPVEPTLEVLGLQERCWHVGDLTELEHLEALGCFLELKAGVLRAVGSGEELSALSEALEPRVGENAAFSSSPGAAGRADGRVFMRRMAQILAQRKLSAAFGRRGGRRPPLNG